MKMFLLRQYANPFENSAAHRTVMMSASMLPIAIINAWLLPEVAFLVTTAMCAVSIAGASQRPTAHEAALPISGKDLAIAKLASAFGLTLLPLMLAALIVAIHSPRKFEGAQLLQGVLLVALGNLLPRLVRPREFKVTPLDTLPLLFAFAISAAAIIYWLPQWIAISIFVAALSLTTALWWRVLPESFQAAGHAPVARKGLASTDRFRSTITAFPVARLIISNLVTKHRILPLASCLFMAIMGSWVLGIMMCLSVEDLWVTTMWWRAYPLSHRARLWMILAPGLLVPAAIILLGQRVHLLERDFKHSLYADAVHTSSQEPSYYSGPTEISLAYWMKAPNGSPPTIVAPWGETAEPYVISVFGSEYYNPYTVRTGSSKVFATWQFGKLTTAVYGYPISRTEYDALRVYPRRINASLRMMILNVAAALTIALLFMSLSGLLKFHRFWAIPKPSIWSLALNLIPGALMFYSLYAVRTLDAPVALIEMRLMQLSTILPDSLLAVSAITLIPVVAAYSLLEWLFARSEFTLGYLKPR